MLVRPVVGKEVLQLEGTVREIDLDARRFEVRGVSDHEIADIRCVYTNLGNVLPRRLLDARVRVRGLVERRSDEAPRLLAVDQIEVLTAPGEHGRPSKQGTLF